MKADSEEIRKNELNEMTKENTGVIISGGSIDEDFVLAFFGQNPGLAGLVAADRGLVFCKEHDLVPDRIVGDFDSADEALLNEYLDREGIQISRFPTEKDWTDTELAVRSAMELGWKWIYLFGGSGTRIDHLLGSLQVMEMAAGQGVTVFLSDARNRIRMCTGELLLQRSTESRHHSFCGLTADPFHAWGDNLSVIPWGGPVEGLTLEGFHYGLSDYDLKTGQALGISNVIEEKEAHISFRAGTLIVAETID